MGGVEKYEHNVIDVLIRLKSALKITSDADLARLMNITPSAVGVWRIRNTIDHQKVITICNERGFDLHWIYFGKGSLKKPKSAESGIPLIPVNAMAGFGSGDMAVAYHDVEKFLIPEFKDRADFLIRITGTSMNPKYFNGDIVACKKVPTRTFLQWGKVYIMDTEQGAICKRVFASNTKGKIICRSENREAYPDFKLSWSDVRSLAIIVGVIRLE